MTNDTKPSARDIKFWEGIKQAMLDRADIVADFDDEEREALDDLRWSAFSMQESAEYLIHFDYVDQVEFCRATQVLCEDFGWSDSENEDKREIAKRSLKLKRVIFKDMGGQGMISSNEAKSFGGIYPLASGLLHTKPNKYQMERFAEHGITWEGEVDEH